MGVFMICSFLMRIIARSMLREFWDSPNRADARIPLEAWFRDTLKAQWNKPGDIKQEYRNASFIADNRVVFNIAGNKYRLICLLYTSPSPRDRG